MPAFLPVSIACRSLGITLYIMLCGRPLYHGPKDPAFAVLASDNAARLLHHYEDYGLCLEPQAFALVSSMLRANPGDRPSLEKVWSHSWVQDHYE
jgi:serine/threonine protein kinase